MKPLRIAFVSMHPSMRRFRKDGSFIYRCENLALALAERGHKTSLLHISALLFRQDFDVVVFLRPHYSKLFQYVVNRLRARNVQLLADVDDLIFDPNSAEFRPSIRNGKDNYEDVRASFSLNASALMMMDKLQFATPELTRRYQELNPKIPCMTIRNAGYRSWNMIQPNKNGLRKISYLVGTRTHDRDFSLVAPVLERLLDRYEDLTVCLVGPLNAGLNHTKVERLDRVTFGDYPQVVNQSHIIIAPLEDTPFNQCKSAVKAMEGAMFNVPTVASGVGDYKEIRVTGVLHANSADEWEAQLEYALDPFNYEQLSVGLRERMKTFADIDKLSEQFINFVNDKQEILIGGSRH